MRMPMYTGRYLRYSPNQMSFSTPPSLSSNMYHYSTPDVFYLFFKPLLGELRKKIEVTSMELNLFFLISPSYCGTIRLLTGVRHGRKNSTKYLINQSLRNNIQIRLIKQWLITPIFFFYPLASIEQLPWTCYRLYCHNLCCIKALASFHLILTKTQNPKCTAQLHTVLQSDCAFALSPAIKGTPMV